MKFRLRLSVHSTDYSPATDEFEFVAVKVDDQLYNLYSRGANGKVHSGLKFLPPLVDGGSGENPSSHFFTILECPIRTDSRPSGIWQPWRDFVDLIVHFDPERQRNRHICFAKRATLGS